MSQDNLQNRSLRSLGPVDDNPLPNIPLEYQPRRENSLGGRESLVIPSISVEPSTPDESSVPTMPTKDELQAQVEQLQSTLAQIQVKQESDKNAAIEEGRV